MGTKIEMIKELWLDNGKIPKNNINFINAELGLFEAMDEYSGIVKKIDKFDVVLLSMGGDGHIASLFPNHSYPEECHVVAEQSSPKIPKDRISLSYVRLNLSKVVFKVITGESKQKVFNASKKNQLLPVNRVSGDLNKFFVC